MIYRINIVCPTDVHSGAQRPYLPDYCLNPSPDGFNRYKQTTVKF